MGTVHRALDDETGRFVAVKRLLDPTHVSRFEIEARLLAQLDHPRVVRVVDHFRDAGDYYIVMELIDGESLHDRLVAEGTPGLPIDEVIEWGGQACEALDYIHEQHIVHRDVKPQNLIVADRGVVLVDFGVARELGESSHGTIAVGTPRYMAPEVFSGGRVSERSDVFSLAVTLVTLIAGTPPSYTDRAPLVGPLRRRVAGDRHRAARGHGVHARAAHLERRRVRRGAGAAAEHARGRVAGHEHRRDRGLPVGHRGHRAHGRGRLRRGRGLHRAGRRVDGRPGLPRRLGRRRARDHRRAPRARPGHRRRRPRERGTDRAGRLPQRPRFAADIARGTNYVPITMLVVPLLRHGSSVGTLTLLDRRDGGAYGPEDVSKAQLFADLAVSAL